METHPESVPINALVPIEGTPLMDTKPPDVFEMTKMIATARIVLPRSMVRLSAGRMSFSALEQSMMFLAGANSVFTGDKLLTTPNPAFDDDLRMFSDFGMKGKRAFTQPLWADQTASAADPVLQEHESPAAELPPSFQQPPPPASSATAQL